MYQGHSSSIPAKIYQACNLLCPPEPLVILDMGARHGEGYEQFGQHFQHDDGLMYLMVEPSPDCINVIKSKYGGHPQISLISGVITSCKIPSKIPFHVLSDDDNQSGNLFSDRDGKYGAEQLIMVDQLPTSVLPARIDFAKINIEGGEYDLLLNSDLFDRIDSFVMELHNQHVPQMNWKVAVALLQNNFNITTFGNLDYKYCFAHGNRVK